MPPTTVTTTTSTTETTTTTVTRTTTTTTTTTSTTTSTTTTLEPAPQRPPLGPKPTDKMGYINMLANTLRDPIGNILTHGHEQGLEVDYFDYSKFPHVVEKESSALYCARRNVWHTMTPDHTSTIPAINYPAHEQHGLGSQHKDNFCTHARGWIELPVTGLSITNYFEVYAKQIMAQHLDSRHVLPSDASTFGAGGPNQNMSRIQYLWCRGSQPKHVSNPA